MPHSENDRTLFSMNSVNLAFHAGQFVESRLLDRALELTHSSQASIVTPDHIEACIDETLLDGLREYLHERAEQESRMVA